MFCHKIKSAILGHHKQKKIKNIRQEILRLLCQISELVSLTRRTFPAVLHTPLFFPIPPYSTRFFVPGLSLVLIRAELRCYSWQGFASTNGKISIKGISGEGTEDGGADDNAEDGRSLLSSGSVCPDGAATHKMSRIH